MSSPTTFVFDERMTQTMEELKKLTGARSKAELVRNAVALFKVAQEAKHAGGKLVIQTTGPQGETVREREIVLP